MGLTAKEYLRKVRITTDVGGQERGLEPIKGLEQLLEDYHQAKLKDHGGIGTVSDWTHCKCEHVDECQNLDCAVIKCRKMYSR